MKHKQPHDCQSFKGLAVIKLPFLVLVGCFFTLPVYAVCTHVSVNGSSFGNISAIDSNLNNYHLADISVTCENSDDGYSLSIDGGALPTGATFRQLSQAASHIPYTLLESATQWGDTGMVTTYNQPLRTGNGSKIYSLYASANTKDKTPAGLYNDTVLLTLKNSNGTTVSTSQNFNLYLDTSCTLNVSGFTSFGSYPFGSANLSNIPLGTISVTCPVNIDYKMGIDKGLHPAGTERQMAFNGTAFIPYQLRCNGQLWGDKGMNSIDINYVETSTENACSPTNIGNSPEQFSISGDAQLQNATSAGIYTDTLIVTLVW